MEHYLADYACGVDLTESVAPDWAFSVPGAFISILIRGSITSLPDALVIRLSAADAHPAHSHRNRHTQHAAPKPLSAASCRAVARTLAVPTAWESVASDVVAHCDTPAGPAVVVVAGPKGSGEAGGFIASVV